MANRLAEIEVEGTLDFWEQEARATLEDARELGAIRADAVTQLHAVREIREAVKNGAADLTRLVATVMQASERAHRIHQRTERALRAQKETLAVKAVGSAKGRRKSRENRSTNASERREKLRDIALRYNADFLKRHNPRAWPPKLRAAEILRMWDEDRRQSEDPPGKSTIAGWLREEAKKPRSALGQSRKPDA